MFSGEERRNNMEGGARGPKRQTGLSLEKSFILVLYILQACIHKRRLRFDEKLNVLRALAWIITHTEFEGLLQEQLPPQLPTPNLLSDNSETTTERYLLT